MRTKKAIINYITETIPEILIMFLGFFRIKFFFEVSWFRYAWTLSNVWAVFCVYQFN